MLQAKTIQLVGHYDENSVPPPSLEGLLIREACVNTGVAIGRLQLSVHASKHPSMERPAKY